MKKLKFCWISFKNNLHNMPGMFILLAFTISLTFLFSGLFMRIVYTYLVEGGKDLNNWEVLSFFIANIAVVAVAVVDTLYIYAHYLKKSAVRLMTYRMLGAKKRHLLLEMALENFVILGTGLLVGVVLDSIMHSLIEMSLRHFYLNAWVFGYAALWTFTVPLLALFAIALFRLKEPAPRVRRWKNSEVVK